MADWENQEKPGLAGGGWDYDEENLTYDEDIDPDTELQVKYDGFGTETTWDNQDKS